VNRLVKCPHCGHDVPIELPAEGLQRGLASAIRSGVPAVVAADQLLESMPEPVAEFFRPAVHREARTIHRGQVRADEKAAFAGKTVTSAEDRRRAKDVHLWQRLMSRTFSVGGIDVTWGRATVSQHMQRIEELEENKRGLSQTQERHRAAVELIRRHGVSCLGEIPAEVVVQSDAAVAVAASAEVVALVGGGAREPVSRADAAVLGSR